MNKFWLENKYNEQSSRIRFFAVFYYSNTISVLLIRSGIPRDANYFFISISSFLMELSGGDANLSRLPCSLWSME